MSGSAEIDRAIARAYRTDWATVLSATVRVTGDVHLAEECAQEAYAAAVISWARDGVPASPAAWLVTVSKRRALDALRRNGTSQRSLEQWRALNGACEEGHSDGAMPDAATSVPDERLRLIFMCCHPALSQEAQLALTLRLVCGLATRDVARALVVSEATMAARVTRAKKKIAVARVPFRVPSDSELAERLRTVLAVVYLLYTMGHTAPSGTTLMRPALADEAVHLGRMLHTLIPDDPEVKGLLALMLASDARRAARTEPDGALVRLADQDRTRWDPAAIAEAHALVDVALRAPRPGPYALQGAIAVAHAGAPSYEETPWAEILSLYDRLLAEWPSPVVALNRAVALSKVAGPAPALCEVERIDEGGRLARYHYLHAVRADLLRALGRADEAAPHERAAAGLAANDAERQALSSRRG